MSESDQEAVRQRLANPIEVPQHNINQFPSTDQGNAGTDDHSIEVTEDGVARGFVAKHGEYVRFDHVASKWFLWVGSVISLRQINPSRWFFAGLRRPLLMQVNGIEFSK